MRSYMYAYGHRNLRHALYTLNTVDLPSKPCDTCDKCSVDCIAGFDVKRKIQDIARLKDVPPEFLTA